MTNSILPEDESTRLLYVAVNAALAAGREVMNVYQGRVDVQWKADRSPLTEADLRAHRVIAERLACDSPEIPVLSEEAADIPYAARRGWSRCWLVDPLDGTKEFIKRNDEFTINIALVQDGAPVAGVVHAPALNRCWLGAVGLGAYRLEIDPGGEPPGTWDALVRGAKALPLTGHRESHRPLIVVASRSHRNAETDVFIESLRAAHPKLELISAGSALKLCLVAEGAADVYPRFAPTMEWDTAAGHAVCAACGIPVRTHPGEEPLTYNKEELLNPWFMIDARARIV